MLLALDVGNTNIVIGFLDESGIRNIARLETDRDKTAHEYAISLRQVIEFSGIAPENIDGAILSSVVPPINGALIAAVRMITGIRPLVVGPGMKTGLNIALDNPAAMGSDLVVGAAAALAIHAPPLIIIDMGTATTMTVIDREARVLGGAIIPGNATVILYAGAEKATELCTVPNLLGRTASEANSLASNAGLILRFTGATNSASGSIVVLNQDVEAGAQVEPGTVISVQLGDTSLND